MAIYICPICDQKMKSKHFCTNCRSYIKEPFVRERTFYLNERHPDNEASCTYHQADERYGRTSDSHKASVPNQPSIASRASLNGAGQTETVPNQPHSFDQTGASVFRQATVPNQPRKPMSGQPVNKESMEGYLKTVKDMGRGGLQGAAELMKEYNKNATQARQSFETSQEDKGKETKKMSTLAMVIFFILFVNIFSDVIIPFLRRLMSMFY